MPTKKKIGTDMHRLQLDASRAISHLIGHHDRYAAGLMRRRDPEAVEMYVRNAARLAALRKALTLVKGTDGK